MKKLHILTETAALPCIARVVAVFLFARRIHDKSWGGKLRLDEVYTMDEERATIGRPYNEISG